MGAGLGLDQSTSTFLRPCSCRRGLDCLASVVSRTSELTEFEKSRKVQADFEGQPFMEELYDYNVCTQICPSSLI